MYLDISISLLISYHKQYLLIHILKNNFAGNLDHGLANGCVANWLRAGIG